MTVTSKKMSQSPRLIKKLDTSEVLFLLLTKKADKPAKKAKAGAQKCVIHRVK